MKTNRDCVANSTEELVKIGDSLWNATTQNRLDEQSQMTWLLKGLTTGEVVDLQFPVRVGHTPEAVPDFQLELGSRRIGIEVAKIALQDVEHARALQRDQKQFLSISTLYQERPHPRSQQQVRAEAFTIPGEHIPPTVEEHDRIWMRSLKKEVEDKTAVLARPEFLHGGEDWLVLWDRIRTSQWQRESRRVAMSQLLAGYWRPEWFARVFLQDFAFRWQMMFTPDGSCIFGERH